MVSLLENVLPALPPTIRPYVSNAHLLSSIVRPSRSIVHPFPPTIRAYISNAHLSSSTVRPLHSIVDPFLY
jgi:hypothetical protein